METTPVPIVISKGKFKGAQDVRFARCATAWKHTSGVPKCANCQFIPYFSSCLSQYTCSREGLGYHESVKKHGTQPHKAISRQKSGTYERSDRPRSSSKAYSPTFTSKHWNWNHELETLIEEMSELTSDGLILKDPLELSDAGERLSLRSSLQNNENDDPSPISLSESAAKRALQPQVSLPMVQGEVKSITRKPSIHHLDQSGSNSLAARRSSAPSPGRPANRQPYSGHQHERLAEKQTRQTGNQLAKIEKEPRTCASAQNQSWALLFQGLHQKSLLPNPRRAMGHQTLGASNTTLGNFGFKLSQKFRSKHMSKQPLSDYPVQAAGCKNIPGQ